MFKRIDFLLQLQQFKFEQKVSKRFQQHQTQKTQMQTTATQELVKQFALDFIHNKTFNLSIMQSLCQQQIIHATTTQQQITSKVNIIAKSLELLKQHFDYQNVKNKNKNQSGKRLNNTFRNLNNMLSILIFNISSINQNYIRNIQIQMAQSTAAQSATQLQVKTLYKDQMALNILRENLSFYFKTFTQNSQFLRSLVIELSETDNIKLTQSELGVLQTLDYICVKYSIQNQISQKIVNLLEKTENKLQQSLSQSGKFQYVKDINKLLFSEAKQDQLFHILQTNSYINIRNLVGLINVNYLNTNPSRKIFKTGEITGKQTIEGIFVRLIRRIGKNQLFSQKNEDYTPFHVILLHFFTKHFPVYNEFNKIVKSLINITNKSLIFTETYLNGLKQIQKFFRIYLAFENKLFQQIIGFIYGELSNKYSDSVAIDLIKKLLLNRFLLNPSLFAIYNQTNQAQLKKYVETANLIRILFYPQKTADLVNSNKIPEFIRISSQILYSLEYCLKKQKDCQMTLQNTFFLYVNDKILKAQMSQLWQDLNYRNHYQKQKPNAGEKIQNGLNQNSLYFSIFKNQIFSNKISHSHIENVSEVKLETKTNRTNHKENQKIIQIQQHHMSGKFPKETSYLRLLPPKSPQNKLKQNYNIQNKIERPETLNQSDMARVSQLARKQHLITHQTRVNQMNLPTDRQLIDQLVDLRKQYGERRKLVRKSCEQRRLKNYKKIGFLNAFTSKFNEFKAEVETYNNSMYIHMTTIT